jgi:hypothetical protein
MLIIKQTFQRGLELARRIFIDLRLIAFVMAVWLFIILVIMIEIGIFSNSSFMSYGPRPGLTFMHVTIDTYYKYNMLIVMIVMHTFITDVIADSLSPHVLNVVQDTRSRYIPHTPITYYSITTIWAVYCSISQLFMVFIAFAQFDLLLVRLFSNLVANLFTTSLYLSGKSYNPSQYQQQQKQSGNTTTANNKDVLLFDAKEDDDSSTTTTNNSNHMEMALEETSFFESDTTNFIVHNREATTVATNKELLV